MTSFLQDNAAAAAASQSDPLLFRMAAARATVSHRRRHHHQTMTSKVRHCYLGDALAAHRRGDVVGIDDGEGMPFARMAVGAAAAGGGG